MQMNKKLYMSFWNYDDFDGYDIPGIVKEWKDTEFNLGMTFLYYPNTGKKAAMLQLLDECHKNGIQAIICDSRTHFHNLQAKGEEQFRQDLQQSIEDFGHHPAAFAFYVGDEPTISNWEYAKQSVRIIEEVSPIPAFVNFLPHWTGDDYKGVMGCDCDEYEQKIDSFIKESGLQIVAYDCYACMNVHHQKAEMDMYFKNLALFTRVARENHVPCWCSSLCMAHWDYRIPTLADMRWQVNTALAYGVTGIQWFAVFDKKRDPNDVEIITLNAPYNRYGERTQTWRDMRDVNGETQARFADIVPTLTWLHSWHYGNTYGETRYWYDGVDDILIHFDTRYKDDALISKFVDDEGNYHFLFVNTNQNVSNEVRVGFSEPYTKYNRSVWLPVGHAFWVKLENS